MDLHDHMLKTCSWSTVEHIYVQSSQIGETNMRCRFEGVPSSLWSRVAHLTMHFASTSLAIFTNLCSCSHNLIICQKQKRKMAEHPTTTYPGSSQISAHFEEEGPYWFCICRPGCLLQENRDQWKLSHIPSHAFSPSPSIVEIDYQVHWWQREQTATHT